MTKKYNVLDDLTIDNKRYYYYNLNKLSNTNQFDLTTMPFSLRIILESLLRNYDGQKVTNKHIEALISWNKSDSQNSVPFIPARIILQDLSGIPSLIDLASIREKVNHQGINPSSINPHLPVDLVVDHSVQVDDYGNPNAFIKNMKIEFERNKERFSFLHWTKSAFKNFKLIPPATGIIHQVNLEYLASIVTSKNNERDETVIYPDTLLGTDSHTTMINSLGVLGWGVGGIEAESTMLGFPTPIQIPEVIGIELKGALKEGVLATDLVLNITKMLRKENVLGKFVEFYGEGLKSLTLDDRATIANMAPEYGATCAFFPVDKETLKYMYLTGRDKQHIKLIEEYTKANSLWYFPETKPPEYNKTIVFNLNYVSPTLSGPKRPQDTIKVSEIKKTFEQTNISQINKLSQKPNELMSGSLVIAAITACTNTSNSNIMITAGLLAKKAVEYGLTVPDYVKTSLAPGSKIVTSYLEKAGLMNALEKLGFYLVGYGCTTCSGNSGPLNSDIVNSIKNNDLTVCSILSGNRNFEGRIHPLIPLNYLASPPLVIAYAIAGTMNIDLTKDALGHSSNGKEIFLKDIWPHKNDVHNIKKQFINPELFQTGYQDVFQEDSLWKDFKDNDQNIYRWDKESTYIKKPPFITSFVENKNKKSIKKARILATFDDSLTTDHISPVGNIPLYSPAGKYLQSLNISPRDFNSYGARRGNHEVMTRGTFANIRIKNLLLKSQKEGGYTIYHPTNEEMTIYEAAIKYKEDKTDLVVVAGKDYGMGSSRDWAAKGTKLLGIKAIVAESFERIHRSNLVMMGVLPLELLNITREQLNITGNEYINIKLPEHIVPNSILDLEIKTQDEQTFSHKVKLRLDNKMEVEYFEHDGILPLIYNKALK